ncbi:MAG TPA: aldo/keto reductase [Tepidisphaeraceae bacterium]|jgi:aryl-alcohol dehydrogenase-like predicted oxidoreductase|nr:aldo/keto reductase [Tepidisphaeraceae bacterium]
MPRMQYRTLGRTGYSVSTISFGAWAVGGSWGSVNDDESLNAMRRALDLGVNFIDTADVYGDGHSERLIAKLAKERPGQFKVATKAGRRLNPHVPAGYTPANIEAFVDRSLQNLQTDCLDLVQLHCPPTAVYYDPALFDGLADITRKGKVRHWGVSVEKVEEALKAINYDIVASVQIIFNAFRLRPVELFFGEAQRRNVGILARVPLASGLLTGKITRDTQFARDDHRNFNRHGKAFDVGETFSGLEDFDAALAAVEELKSLLPPGVSMAAFALRWILMHEAVSCAIPGAKRADQVDDNVSASDLPALSDLQMKAIEQIYDRHVRGQVHQKW